MTVFSEFFLNVLRTAGAPTTPSDLDSLSQFYEWISTRPKVETHVHMEAAVDEAFYLQGFQPDAWQSSFPWNRAPFDNLRGFITAWVDLTKSMRVLSDFERLAEAFVEQRVRDNIRYSEVYISPADFSFIRKRFSIAPEVFDFESVLRSYVQGLKRGLQKHGGVEVRLIVDSLWISTEEERRIIFESLGNVVRDPSCCDEKGDSYIIAVGLGGMETDQSLSEQRHFFSNVRTLGLKVDIHSGEGGDSQLHRKSVAALQPDRVAHGFSACTEGFVFKNNLIMCPLSNLLLKTFKGMPHEHPVFECLRHGIPLSVGSDDPLLLGNSLALEYTFLHAVAGQGAEIFDFTQRNARERVLAPQVLSRVNDLL